MAKDAEKLLNKAEKLYKAMQYKRAAKVFSSAADLSLKLKKYELARDCYVKAAKCSINEQKYSFTLDFLRNAGNMSILINNFLEAQNFFREGLNYISNLRTLSDRNYNFILFSTLSFLCLFVKGKQEEGLKLVKKYRSNVEDDFFKESQLIRLITNLTLSIKNKNESYLEKILTNFESYRFHESEINLLKQALVIAKVNTSLKINLKFDKDVYTTNDIIHLIMEIDSKPLLEISNDPFFNYKIRELKISKISITLSDNFTSYKKPEFPISINVGDSHITEFMFKPHFQTERPFIGPMVLTSEINGNLNFYYEFSEVLEPVLISPPPSLTISLKNLKPPLIGTTFPLEILIENKSEGEAIDLKTHIEFPENLKLMRGTLEKQIYSLKPNENIRWEINVKPTEAGDYIIKIIAQFSDPDKNLITESKEFPVPIKL